MTKHFFGTYGSTLGQRLRLLRQDREWTQVQFAEELKGYGQNVTNAWISEIEKSARDKMPSIDLLIAMAKALGTTTDFLLLLTDDPMPPGDITNHHWSPEADEAGAIIDALPPDWRVLVLEEVKRLDAEWRSIQRQDKEALAFLDKVEAAGGGVARAIAEQFIHSRLQQLRRGSRSLGVVDETSTESA